VKYPYHIEPEVLIATKQERCQGFACYNKIEPDQAYYIVTTEFMNKGIEAKQTLCVKCMKHWFNGKIDKLLGDILDVKNQLGKVELLAEKYYGQF
jgi:hypothetical protein